MPGIKISQLTETTSPQTTDEFVIQRGGIANYKLKLSNIPLTSINVTGLTAGKPLQVNSGGTAVESASDTGSGAVVRATSPTITSPTITSPTITIEGTTSTGATGSGKLVFDTSPTISSPTISGHATIEGVTPTGATGTGKFVFDTSPTISSPTISSPTISGNYNLSVSTITSSTTAGNYATYIINANSGNVTLTLPSAATYTSRRYTIMRIDTYQHSSSYKAMVVAASGETINGMGLVNLANFDSITVQSNGTNWVIIGGGMS